MNALIQACAPANARIFELTRDWHSSLCRLHGMQHFVRQSKALAISSWLASAPLGACACFLEFNVLWMDATFNPCTILPAEFDIGMTKNINGQFDGNVIFLRNSIVSQSFDKEVCRVMAMRDSDAFAQGLGMGSKEKMNCVIERWKVPVKAINSRFNWHTFAGAYPDGPTVFKQFYNASNNCVFRRIEHQLSRLTS